MPVFKQWVLSHSPKNRGLSENNFEMQEEYTPHLRKGQVLCRALFLSVDPITRLYLSYSMTSGDLIPGRQVARIVESRHRGYPKGMVS